MDVARITVLSHLMVATLLALARDIRSIRLYYRGTDLGKDACDRLNIYWP